MFSRSFSQGLILLVVAPSLLWITVGGNGCGGSGLQTNPAGIAPGEILHEGFTATVHEVSKALISPASGEGSSGLTTEVDTCLPTFEMTALCPEGGSMIIVDGTCEVTDISLAEKVYQYSGHLNSSTCGPFALNGPLLFQMSVGPTPLSCLIFECPGPVPMTMELTSSEDGIFMIGDHAATNVMATFEGEFQFGTLTGDFTKLVGVIDGQNCSLVEGEDVCMRSDVDVDGDGFPDDADNCPEVPNAYQVNADGDPLGDLCDACPYNPDPDCGEEKPAFVCSGEPPALSLKTQMAPVCGDCFLQLGEQCEPGAVMQKEGVCPEGQTCDPNGCTCVLEDDGIRDCSTAPECLLFDCLEGEFCRRGECVAFDSCGDGFCKGPLAEGDENVTGCPADCYCGNGQLDDGEECDPTGGSECASGKVCILPLREGECTCAASTAVCGNGFVEAPFEECDDANELAGDGCDDWCRSETSICGDGRCDIRFEPDPRIPETYCPEDCGGVCGPLCGNNTCEPEIGEDAATCPLDCPTCGNFICEAHLGETCEICADDCCPPPPPPVCGDQFCDVDGGETCENCGEDCCPPPPPDPCGDKFCDPKSETCDSCAKDCCPPVK